MTGPSEHHNEQKEKDSNAIQLAKITTVQAVLVALIGIIPAVIAGVLSYQAGAGKVNNPPQPTEIPSDPKEADSEAENNPPEPFQPPVGSETRDDPATEDPLIIIMDSHNTQAVYSETMQGLFGSNTDDISEIIDDIYGSGSIRREATNPNWNREESITAQDPDLVIIHKSAFYDYNSANDRSDLDKLVNVLNSIAEDAKNSRFLVYSSGFCNAAGEEDLYASTQDLVRRIDNFANLKDRVHYFGVCYEKSENKEIWKEDALRRTFKQKVKYILQRPS